MKKILFMVLFLVVSSGFAMNRQVSDKFDPVKFPRRALHCKGARRASLRSLTAFLGRNSTPSPSPTSPK